MGVVSRRCVCLVGVVVRRYIDFLILLIPIYILLLYLLFFAAASLLFVHLKKCFSFLFQYIHFFNLFKKNSHAQYKQTYGQLQASHGSRMKGCT